MRIHWSLDDFKSNQKSVWSYVVFFKIHIKSGYSVNFIQYPIHLIYNTNVKNISFGQNKRFKNAPFFFRLHELKHKVCLSKSVCGIFHFQFRYVFIKVAVTDIKYFARSNSSTSLVQRKNFSLIWQVVFKLAYLFCQER